MKLKYIEILAVVLTLGLSNLVYAQEITVIKMIDSITGGEFIPNKLTIKVGTTVKWENDGGTSHGATNDPSMAMKQSDVSAPAGIKSFDSGLLAPSEDFSYTFTVPGTYKYVCLPHEAAGMVGEIIVTK